MLSITNDRGTRDTVLLLLWTVCILSQVTNLLCQSPLGEAQKACKPYYHESDDTTKISCVCSSDYCDDLVFDWPQSGQILKVESSQAGKRFAQHYSEEEEEEECRAKNDNDQDTNDVHAGGQCFESSHHQQESLLAEGVDYTIKLNISHHYQTIYGWGGSFTDAAAINIDKLSKRVGTILLEQYFGPKGLRYDFSRVPISSSDFSNRTYTYNDVEGPDYEQQNWTLATEDTQLKIPLIKQARRMAKLWNGQLRLIASSWSPPNWMKTNGSPVRGFLKGPSTADGKVYRAYAHYLLKFLQAYKENGLQVWGMSVQNEPVAAYLPFYFFNSLQFSSKDQVNFLKYHLGPLLEENGFDKATFKLIIGDDSIGFSNIQVDDILSDGDVKKYISGLGIHWYLSNLIVPYSYIDSLYEKHKNDVEFIMSTEACNGYLPSDTKVVLGDWSRGVAYAKDIIETTNRHVNGWIDWNLALDMEGGPNWAKNFVDSPIIVDYDNDTFYKNPMYYALGHFTRFVPAGSIRIETTIEKGNSSSGFFSFIGGPHDILGTGFVSPSKKYVTLVVVNKSSTDKVILLDLIHGESLTKDVSKLAKLTADSITTLVYGI